MMQYMDFVNHELWHVSLQLIIC